MADERSTTILSIKIDNGEAIKRIAELSRKYDENKARVKELQKELKGLDKTSAEYEERAQGISEEIAATNAQSNSYKKTISELNKVVASSIKESEAQEGSLKALRIELSRLTKEYDSMAEVERKGAEGTALKERINALTEEIKGGEEATGRFQRSVGSYEVAIRNALGANNGFAGSMLGLAEGMGTANGVLPGLKANIAGLGGALKVLIANPAFLAILGMSKVAEGFKFWFDFNKGLNEATRLTEQFTGLSGDALTTYRDKVQAVADVYGKDFKEVMQGANAIANQFGVTYDEAINAIKDGFVAGADVSGEFLDTIKEYPAFFKEAGLSAEEFIAISTEAAKAGVYSDKGVDAIKEATLRLREMTTATKDALTGIGLSGDEIQKAMAEGTMTAFDAIQKVSEKLNELPATSTQVGTAIADIFGGPGEDAGLQYLKTLKAISTDLDVVKGKAGEYASLQDSYLDSQIKLQQAVNALFGSSNQSFNDLLTEGKTFLNNVLAELINGVISLGNYFVDLYNGSIAIRVAWEAVVAGFKTGFSIIKNVLQGIANYAKAVGTVLQGVFTLDFDKVKQGWQEAGNALKGVVTGFVKDAKDTYEEGFENLQKRVPKLTMPVDVQINAQSTTANPSLKAPAANPSKSNAAQKASEKAAKEAEARAKKGMEDLKRYEEELKAIIVKNTYTEIEQINERYDAEIEGLKKSFEENKAYSNDVSALEAQKNNAIMALNAKRNEEIAAANKKASDEEIRRRADEYAKMQEDEALQRATKLMRMQLNGATDVELLKEQQRQINLELEALRVEDFDSFVEYEHRKTELELQEADIRKGIALQEAQQAADVMGSTASLFGALQDIVAATSEDEEEAARRGKVLALAEIAFDTGVAIAQGVASAMEVPFPANIAAIVATVAAVVANIATAIKTVNGAKFATGGLVTGEGTATSDSIPAMLSNGESVMTAAATAMFAPMLSAFNQIGGGVPITKTGATADDARGEELLSKAFARGVESMPAPVVSVKEITRVSDRVRVVENLGVIRG